MTEDMDYGEPLRYGDWIIEKTGDFKIFSDSWETAVADGIACEGYARRIVACVNACQHIPTDKLEEGIVAESFGTVTWDTLCASCARAWDTSYNDYMRAEDEERRASKWAEEAARLGTQLVAAQLELSRQLHAPSPDEVDAAGQRIAELWAGAVAGAWALWTDEHKEMYRCIARAALARPR